MFTGNNTSGGGVADATNSPVQYVSDGNRYIGYKQFAIKIGLVGTDSAIVPRVGDLRAIALQM